MHESRRIVPGLTACLLAVLLLSAGSVAADLPSGRPAPFFALPTLDERGQVASDTLFEAASATVLAFWTTHCSECVHRLQACQALQDWGGPDGLRVVGINFDETYGAKLPLFAQHVTPRLTQLYDAGGRAAAAYGAGSHSFSLFVVDLSGTLRAAHFELSPDSIAALRPQLRRVMDEGLEEEPVARAPRPGVLEELGLLKPQRLEVHGRARIRWMDLDTTGVGVAERFGGGVKQGRALGHRLELELAYAVTPRLEAGGLIRLSTEDDAVLRSGPEYLARPAGSAFVRYQARGRVPGLGEVATTLRGGYYRASFTPLTLMRWDANDSPITGGQRGQGCGCPGGAGQSGFVRIESLEKLGPEYTFEGGRLDLSLARRFDLVALYARPWAARRPACRDQAGPDCVNAWLTERADLQYQQEVYAGRVTAQLPVPWASDVAGASATALSVQDDAADWTFCIHPLTFQDDRLLGADVRVPLPLRMEANAEVAHSRWTGAVASDDQDPTLPPGRGAPVEATAWRAAWTLDLRSGATQPIDVLPAGMRARAELAYQRVGADFHSPFSAVSYEANLPLSRQTSRPGMAGPRGLLRVEWGPVGLGLFVKDLRPLNPGAPQAGRRASGARTMLGLWADCDPWPGGTAMVGWLRDEREPLRSQGSVPHDMRRTLVVGLEQRLAPRCTLGIEVQDVAGEGLVLEDESLPPDRLQPHEYSLRTLRCMLDVEF